MTDARMDGSRGIGALLRDLADGGSTLVRRELSLARLEFGEAVRGVGTGTALVASGGVLALLGLLTLIIGLILLGGDQWLRDRYWLAALIAFVITAPAALWLARHGKQQLSPRQLVPDQTVETLKEDREWLRRRLTSDATSS
jgi:uncharacterized membrane protein YqjE